MKPALLIIDMINDFQFDHGEVLAKKAIRLTRSNFNLKKAFLMIKNWPVIYINDHYNLWQADLEKIIDFCTNERSSRIIDKIIQRRRIIF